ncbi:MAG: hypothetical protein E5V21_21705, partial [Mesorhizobium sp.]
MSKGGLAAFCPNVSRCGETDINDLAISISGWLDRPGTSDLHDREETMAADYEILDPRFARLFNSNAQVDK